MPNHRLTLLLVDDHPLFIDGFASMLRVLRPHWQLLSALTSAEAQVLLGATPGIDVILVDLQLPDIDGYETVRRMKADYAHVPITIISGREDAAARIKSMRAGANGFIAKTASAQEIVALIEQIGGGSQEFGKIERLPALSERQSEILQLLATGCANKEIRHRLGIAERTVRAHLTEIFQSLAVNSRVQAILKAQALGMID